MGVPRRLGAPRLRHALLWGLVLLAMTQCATMGDCEREAYGEGLTMTVYNPEGIATPGPFRRQDYGDHCHGVATGTFTPLAHPEGFWRYTPPAPFAQAAGWWCTDGTIVRINQERVAQEREELAQKLRACTALRQAGP